MLSCWKFSAGITSLAKMEQKSGRSDFSISMILIYRKDLGYRGYCHLSWIFLGTGDFPCCPEVRTVAGVGSQVHSCLYDPLYLSLFDPTRVLQLTNAQDTESKAEVWPKFSTVHQLSHFWRIVHHIQDIHRKIEVSALINTIIGR